MKSSWIEHTSGIFKCEVHAVNDSVYIWHNGKIAKRYEASEVESWDMKQWIDRFECISGTKQADLWKETK